MVQYTPQQQAVIAALARPQQQALPGMVPGAQPAPRAQVAPQPTTTAQPSMIDSVGDRFGQTPLGGFIKQNFPDVFYGFGEALKGKGQGSGAVMHAPNRARIPDRNVVGETNAFQPRSVQNSTRWQTGY